MDPQSHAEHLDDLKRMIADQRALHDRLDQIQAQQAERPAPPPLDPKDFDTIIVQVRRLAQKDVHPTWMHAAYTDLAQRLARVDERLEDLEASLSLLHTKMETIIGQLAAPAAGAGGMRRLTLLGLVALGALAACANERPMPALPPVVTDQQREVARACQATYGQCQAGCGTQGLSWALGAQQIHERTKCVNNCKDVLEACYQTLP
jgi:hypothetical protein